MLSLNSAAKRLKNALSKQTIALIWIFCFASSLFMTQHTCAFVNGLSPTVISSRARVTMIGFHKHTVPVSQSASQHFSIICLFFTFIDYPMDKCRQKMNSHAGLSINQFRLLHSIAKLQCSTIGRSGNPFATGTSEHSMAIYFYGHRMCVAHSPYTV